MGFRHRLGSMGLVSLVLFACSAKAQEVAATRVLTRIEEVKGLTASEAGKALPVRVRGVVTTLSGWKNSFFLQDQQAAISVDRTDNTNVSSGDEAEIVGSTASGLFAPIIVATHVALLRHGLMPKPQRADYAALATGRLDGAWVQVEGVVRSSMISESWGRRILFLTLRMGGTDLTVRVLAFDKKDTEIVGAKVKVEGACGTVFNDRRQLTGVRLFVPSMKKLHIEEAAPADRFQIAEMAVGQIFQFGAMNAFEHEIKVSGIVTYQDPVNHRLYLQSGDSGIVVNTTQETEVRAGDQVQAVGFLVAGQYSITLDNAVFRKAGRGAVPAARAVSAGEMIREKDGFRYAPYDGLLTRTTGRLVEKVRQGEQQIWILRDGSQVFQATLGTADAVQKLERIREGSRVELTGVSRTELNQRMEPQGFFVLIPEASDVVLLMAPWWDAKRTIWLAGMLSVTGLVMLIWAMQTYRALSDLRPAPTGSVANTKIPYAHIARVAGLGVAAVGTLSLVGWMGNVSILRTMAMGGAVLYPNVALSVLFAGAALMLSGKSKQQGELLKDLLAAAAGLIGMLTLVEYVWQVNLHIDEAMFRDYVSPTHARMALATAIDIVLLSVSLLLAGRRRLTMTSQILACVAGLLCVVTLLGKLYAVPALFSFGFGHEMAFPALTSCAVLCGGILALQWDRGLMAVITSAGPGGIVARMLLPAAVLVPAGLGWIQWKGEFSFGLYSSSVGLALFTSSVIVVFGSMILASAALLNRTDAVRGQMQYAATHDALTKLLNRRGILEMLRVEIIRASREKKPMSVAIADVDHFKAINDELGHQAGDEVLKEIAKRLKCGLRAYDGVGRYGGEEFLLVLPGCELKSAVMRAEKICGTLAGDAMCLAELPRKVTISMGVSTLDWKTAITQEELVRAADLALYEAKNNGRNQVRPVSAQPMTGVLTVR